MPTTAKKRRHVMMAMQWYSHMYHRGIARYAREAGWSLDASSVHMHETPALERADGIVANLFAETEAVWNILGSSLPIVNLGMPFFKAPLPMVLMDNLGVGKAVGDFFLSRGFRHFAFGAHDDDDWAARARLQGLRTALSARGLDCEFVASRANREVVMPLERFLDTLGKRLRAMTGPVAFMAHNDDFAITVLRACANAGLRVPDDVAVIGCDNDELICEFAYVPLSSADCRLEQQGYEAAALLDRLMDGEKPPHKPLIVPHGGIVERQSSNILAVAHPGLAVAIRTIRTRFSDPLLSVESLAQEARMTRRGLDMACQTHIGRTVSEELRRVRVERALHLLETEDTSIADVARLCGYGRVQHLRNTVLRERGLTPREYRRQAARTAHPPSPVRRSKPV